MGFKEGTLGGEEVHLFFKNYRKKDTQLEEILRKLQMNMSNNYKDAAQENLKEFQNIFQKYVDTNKLNEKQKDYYKEKLSALLVQMKHYTHKDQKTTW